MRPYGGFSNRNPLGSCGAVPPMVKSESQQTWSGFCDGFVLGFSNTVPGFVAEPTNTIPNSGSAAPPIQLAPPPRPGTWIRPFDAPGRPVAIGGGVKIGPYLYPSRSCSAC